MIQRRIGKIFKLPLWIAMGVALSSSGAKASVRGVVQVADLIGGMETTMARLGAPLELTSDERDYLVQGAMQLDDPRTGRPFETLGHNALPYYVLDSDGSAVMAKRRTVLFIGGIHADEVNPMVSSWRALLELGQGISTLSPGVRLIYVPLANPDGLIASTATYGKPTRDNKRCVDLNRNFGAANPETETRFLMALIKSFRPDAIVALHAPYGWLDYDGPALDADASPELAQAVDQWLQNVRSASQISLPDNRDFRTYHGSLGEYAGSKLRIHTLTFEFPGKEASLGQEDWKAYGPALLKALDPPI